MKHLISLIPGMALLLALWGGTEPASAALPPSANDSLPTDACATSDCKVYWPVLSLGCTTGSCDPGDFNASGIYVANQNDYCLNNSHGWSRLCPEAFVNTESGVYIALRDTRPSGINRWHAELSAFVNDESGTPQPVDLLSIGGSQTWLTLQYKRPEGSTVYTAQGPDLKAVSLHFTFTRPWAYPLPAQTYRYDLRLSPVEEPPADAGLPADLHRYTLTYRESGSDAAWTEHCKVGGVGVQSSFLVGREVDGVTAEVHPAPEVTTVSCETGAIDTCMAWRYSPWNTSTHDPESGEYLFRTCLQAKRAAYFVGLGDPKSYTKTGTKIFKRDQYGINSAPVDRLEAIWSPRGAVCLNPQNRRRRDICLPDAYLSQVPECKDEHLRWSEYGKLATGSELILVVEGLCRERR